MRGWKENGKIDREGEREERGMRDNKREREEYNEWREKWNASEERGI